MSCPIRGERNSFNWKSIEDKYGEGAVYEAWAANNYTIPTLEDYEGKIRPTPKPGVETEKYTTSREIYEETLTIVSNIVNTADDLEIRIDGEGAENYFHKKLNKFVGRVTNLQKALYRKGKSKIQLLEQELNENSAYNEQLKRGGTRGHDLKEYLLNTLIKNEIPVKPNWISQEDFQKLSDQVSYVIEDSRSIQSEIDPTKEPIFLTEVSVYNADDEMAGTIDLLVIFSDKSGAVYDWKFRNMKLDEDGNIISSPFLELSKRESWDSQLSQYAKTLAKYGIKKIRRARIVPIYISYMNINNDFVRHIITPESKEDPAAKVLSVSKEFVDDRGLHKTIESLKKKRAEIEVKLKARNFTERDLAQLDTIEKALHAVMIEGELISYLDFIDEMLDQMDGDLAIFNPEEEGYILNDTISSNIGILELFKENTDSLLVKISKEKNKVSQEDYNLIKEKVASLNSKMANIRESFNNVLEERIKIQGDIHGVEGILELQKEKSGSFWVTYLSDWDHPIFKLFSKRKQDAIDDVRDKTREAKENIERVQHTLSIWAKSKGMSLQQAFNKIINSSGMLVTRFTSEFWQEREKAILNKDIEWMQENYEMTKESRDKMLSRRKDYEDHIKSMHNNPEVQKKRMSWWDSKNNVLGSPHAWISSTNRYISVKNPDKHTSSEWSYIQQNKPLKDFFEMHENYMIEFDKILNLPEVHIAKNFVANVHKDMMDTLLSTGISGVSSSFKNSLEIRQDDDFLGTIDSEGKPINVIPLLYLNPVRNSKGDIDNTQKSFDLGRSLILFAQMAYNYEAMSKIEDEVSLMKWTLASQDQILTDYLGNTVYEDVGKTRESHQKGSDKNKEAFDRFVEYYLYGRSLSSKEKDIEVPIGGRTYSGNKIIVKTLSYHSLVSLSFNVISAAGAMGGSFFNTLSGGAKRLHYDNKGIAASMKDLGDLVSGGRKKLVGVWDLLDISQENHSYKRANDLASKRLNKWFTFDKFFAAHRKVDEFIDLITLGGMMRKYGFDEKGQIKRLSLLPPNTKSLWESVKLENNKISIVDSEGNVASKKESRKFRLKVRRVAAQNKGNMSAEDINLAQTAILGRLLGQFRGWIPAMWKERFGDTRYDEVLEEVQFGRYRLVVGEFWKSGVLPTIKEFLGAYGELLMIYKGSNSMDTKAGNFFYEKYKEENPNSEITKEEFFQLRKSQFRAAASELAMYFAILPIILAAFSMADGDDDENSYALKKFAKIMNRTSLELGFFFNPTEFTQLLQSPVPVTSLLKDVTKLATHVLTLDPKTGKDIIKLTPVLKGLYYSMEE